MSALREVTARDAPPEYDSAEAFAWMHGYNAALSALAADRAGVGQEVEQRDMAIAMLASWVACVQRNGTGWDDWDEAYKDAAYRPTPLRELLDAAIAKELKSWESPTPEASRE